MFSADALSSTLTAVEFAAVAVFAGSGALAASRKEMDVFGFALLATVTGTGGGTVRDMLLGNLPVFWVKEPVYLVICLVVAALMFFTAHLMSSRYRVLVWLDAIGLALVAVLGAERALAMGAGPLVAVTMGVITAAFGGIIRDVLSGEPPLLLSRHEIYVTAAMAGAILFVALTGLGVPRIIAIGAGFVLGFVLRALAIRHNWALPGYKARPGRDPGDIGF